MPPRHSKLATVHIAGKNQQFLLESMESLLADKGVLVESGLAQSDKDGRFTLVLQNHSAEPIHLEAGEVVACAQTAEIVPSTTPEEEESVRHLKPVPGPLTLDVTIDETTFPHLSPEERNQLQSCLQEYVDLFANGDSDLGSTDMVTHTIDTDDRAPIKQPPRAYPLH